MREILRGADNEVVVDCAEGSNRTRERIAGAPSDFEIRDLVNLVHGQKIPCW